MALVRRYANKYLYILTGLKVFFPNEDLASKIPYCARYQVFINYTKDTFTGGLFGI